MTTPRMDPDNPVVKLCAAGMQAEAEGRHADARRQFEQAWSESTSDYEACIAAHYVARHQPDAQATLHWNQVALDRARAAAETDVRVFYPSLYLNLGHSFEVVGDLARARAHLAAAAERLHWLPAGPYADLVRGGVAAAQERTRAKEQAQVTTTDRSVAPGHHPPRD